MKEFLFLCLCKVILQNLKKHTASLYNYMEKADFLYFEFKAPNKISLFIFQDSSVKFSAKVTKK